MRFPRSLDDSGLPTLVLTDEFGAGDHAFSDGDPVLFDATLGVNGDATEVESRWHNDVTRNIKYAAREGNGAQGTVANAVNDNPYELASSVNRAADVLTGESSFVARGLRFTTDGANFNVTLSEGVIVYEGRKYHVTDAKLNAITVEVDGSDAGTGNAFALIASRDLYVSIAPLADDDAAVLASTGSLFTMTVTDTANGAGAPSAPAGEFFFAMLETDGSGVANLYTMNSGSVLAADSDANVRLRAPSDGSSFLSSLQPTTNNTVDLGALESGDSALDSGGHFFRTAYVGRMHMRTSAASGSNNDHGGVWNARTTTVGASNGTMTMFDLDDYPNSSFVEFEATVVGLSDSDNGYSRTVRQAAIRRSDGTMGLYGTIRDVGGGALDPGGTSDSDAIFIDTAEGDGSLIQLRVTGTAGATVNWFASFRTVEKWGS